MVHLGHRGENDPELSLFLRPLLRPHLPPAGSSLRQQVLSPSALAAHRVVVAFEAWRGLLCSKRKLSQMSQKSHLSSVSRCADAAAVTWSHDSSGTQGSGSLDSPKGREGMVTQVASHDDEALGPLWVRFSSVNMGTRIGSFGSSFEPSVVAHLVTPTLRRPREANEVRASLTCAVGLCLKKPTSLGCFEQ